MKALSIRQPWAWAIIHAGKDVENRTWHTRFRGPLLIHASKTFDHDGYEWLVENEHLLTAEVPPKDEIPRGGIVGKAMAIDCVDDHPSPFFFGPWGIVLKESKPVPFIPYRGQLGLFDVPDEILEVM